MFLVPDVIVMLLDGGFWDEIPIPAIVNVKQDRIRNASLILHYWIVQSLNAK